MSKPINPLDDADPDLRRMIEEEAYHLWKADGEPHGRSEEYWERARELVGIRIAGPTGLEENPAAALDADPLHQETIEEASIQENLGEFPDRFADQGEKSSSPKTKAKRKSGAKKSA